MEFEKKERCVFSIWQYHIKHSSLEYSIYKSDTKQYITKCVSQKFNFKCRVSLGKGCGRWIISKFSGQHTCTSFAMSQVRRKFDSNIIYDNIKTLINSNSSLKVKHIITHICEKHNDTISYKTARISKNKPIACIYWN